MTKEEIKAKIESIQSTIDDLEGLYDIIVTTGLVQEYQLNDGQTITKMIYKTPEQVKNAIEGLQKRLHYYTHKLVGRQIKLRPRDSFNINKY